MGYLLAAGGLAAVASVRNLVTEDIKKPDLVEKKLAEPEIIIEERSPISEEFNARVAEDMEELSKNIPSIREFANKETRDGDGLSRLEYVNEHIKFSDSVPQSVQELLRALMSGLCAKESDFNDNRVSKRGARGIFQFMPSTWNDVTKTEQAKHEPLTRQVEVAGKYFSGIHSVITKKSRDSLKGIEETYFPHGGFEEYFLAPCVLNGYNVGPTGMAGVINWFWKNYGLDSSITKDMKEYSVGPGYDLFLRMSDLARNENKYNKHLSNYRKDSNGYVPRIYAYTQLLNPEVTRLVQNPTDVLPDQRA